MNFGDSPEPLYIPYDSIKTFVDPSVEFGLRFESQDEDEDDLQNTDLDLPDDVDLLPVTQATSADRATDSDAPKTKADVVSLDSFRKT